MSMPALLHSEVPARPTPGSWLGADLRASDWRTRVPEDVVMELDAALAAGTAEAAAEAALFPLTARWLAGIRERLCAGHGIVAAAGLPVERWGDERSHHAVRLVSGLLGPPVAQTHAGETFYSVTDRGLRPAPGVRRSLTNVEQAFHTDGPWVRNPPRVIALFCLRAAATGGVSRCMSLRRVVADLACEAPGLAARLASDVIWHRQGEHGDDADPVSRLPMVWYDDRGHWAMRWYADYVRSGYRTAGAVLDADAAALLARMGALAAEPRRRIEFKLAPGEVLWVNNRWCAHARTAFEAARESGHPRLMIRVWHRFGDAATTLDG